MIKAVIRYGYIDNKSANYYLSKCGAHIIKTREELLTNWYRTTILIDSEKDLMEIVSLLNEKSYNGIQLVKSRETINLFGYYI